MIKSPRLTPAQLVHHLKQYRETGNVHYRNIVVLATMPLIHYMVLHGFSGYASLPYEDKVHEATIGFMKTCDVVALDGTYTPIQCQSYIMHGARMYLKNRCRKSVASTKNIVHVEYEIDQIDSSYDSYNLLMRTELESMLRLLTDNQRRVMSAILREPGTSHRQLAKKLKISQSGISKIYVQSIQRLQQYNTNGLLRR
jgi:RNA polymerase sigma factor (sigma-70 family)